MIDNMLAEGRTAEVYEHGDDHTAVLKLWREDFIQEDADYEAEITQAVKSLGVRCPEVYDVIHKAGRRGIVYERVHGHVLSRLFRRQPFAYRRWAGLMAASQVAIHRAHTQNDTFPKQKDVLQNRIYAARGLNAELRDKLLLDLKDVPDGDAICHGDLHPRNIIVTDDDTVAIDWINATRGDPASDVARSLLLLQLMPLKGPPGFRPAMRFLRPLFMRTYLARYRSETDMPLSAIHTWMPIMAAARMAEGVETEYPRLLSMIGRGIVRQGEG